MGRLTGESSNADSCENERGVEGKTVSLRCLSVIRGGGELPVEVGVCCCVPAVRCDPEDEPALDPARCKPGTWMETEWGSVVDPLRWRPIAPLDPDALRSCRSGARARVPPWRGDDRFLLRRADPTPRTAPFDPLRVSLNPEPVLDPELLCASRGCSGGSSRSVSEGGRAGRTGTAAGGQQTTPLGLTSPSTVAGDPRVDSLTLRPRVPKKLKFSNPICDRANLDKIDVGPGGEPL